MKISQSDTSTLLVAITEALQDGKITKHGSFKIDTQWENKTINALSEEFSKILIKSLDGSSLSFFLRERLKYIKVESRQENPNSETSITKLECFSDPLKLARRIVSDLSRIPTSYRMLVPICQELADRIECIDINVKISDRLTIYSSDRIPSSFKFKHDDNEIDDIIISYHQRSEFELKDDRLFLEFRGSGYLSGRKKSGLVEEFYDETRSFYGACLVYGIISSNPSFFIDELEPYLVSNSIIDGKENLAHVERVDEDIARCANLATTSETDDMIENGISIDEIMSPVKSVFNKTNSEKLKTACAWNLRSHLSSRELDKILESAITIEVLMGDRETSDRIGLTKLMANRCAYAIGKNSEDRESIIKFFIDFYRVRSEVVHSGRTFLRGNEKKIVDKGLDLATNILRNEISISTDRKS
ncbi:hypothetical protein [Sphingobium sp.]|uniref:hypothetical protein n=1 Tax=Sphingobium sp. TaxID=1912891 RepID=UPI002C9C3F5B|nr:hypothetical protein [Sphingobium sp.]HUD92754.1 hypothetical protein [Sphingobium sp.]